MHAWRRLRQGGPPQAQTGVSVSRRGPGGIGGGGVDYGDMTPVYAGKRGLFRDVEMTVMQASGPEAARLAIDQSALVYRIRRLRLFQGKPFMLEQSYLPERLFPDLEERATPPYQLLEISATYGIVLARAQERSAETTADWIVAERLRTAEGIPLLLLDRVVYSREGEPIEWRLAQCRLRDGHFRTGMR
jgi:DNA-binding GntR family transcriptional regulator